MTIKKISIISSLLAFSIVLSYFESFIPTFLVGVKLGLANIVILVMIYDFELKESFIVLLLRIIIISFIKGSFLQITFFMSLSGGLCAFLGMVLLKQTNKFDIISVSVIGAMMHAFGQIIVAIIATSTIQVIFYLPLIALLSIVMGIFTGVVAKRYLNLNIRYDGLK